MKQVNLSPLSTRMFGQELTRMELATETTVSTGQITSVGQAPPVVLIELIQVGHIGIAFQYAVLPTGFTASNNPIYSNFFEISAYLT